MNQLQPEIEALALGELERRVKARKNLVKATLGTDYPDGRRNTVRSPLDGLKLGIVYRTDPDPVWKVTDADALDAHLRTFPGNLETVHEIAEMGQAIAYLHDHAPHLLVEITRVRADVVEAAVAQSEATNHAAAPGITQVKPAGSLTVTPDDNAGIAIERLVNAGRLTWDGRPVLEAGEEVAS